MVDDVEDDRLGALLATIANEGTPFALSDPNLNLSPDVVYRLEPGVSPDGGALWSCAGSRAYAAVAARWLRTMDDELWQCEQRVTRRSRTSPTEAVVRWETQYIPAKLRWLWDLGQAWPGVRVTTYDILDKMGEISRFSWRGLFMLFFRAATKGEMRLPAALIKGTSRLTFRPSPIPRPRDRVGETSELTENDDMYSDIATTTTTTTPTADDDDDDGHQLVLVSHEETIDLVTCVNAPDVVKNRRVCRDLLEFLDARKPPDTSLAVGMRGRLPYLSITFTHGCIIIFKSFARI